MDFLNTWIFWSCVNQQLAPLVWTAWQSDSTNKRKITSLDFYEYHEYKQMALLSIAYIVKLVLCRRVLKYPVAQPNPVSSVLKNINLMFKKDFLSWYWEGYWWPLNKLSIWKYLYYYLIFGGDNFMSFLHIPYS